METFCACLALLKRNRLTTSHKESVICGFDFCPNKLLNTHSSCPWFEAALRTCDIAVIY